MVISTRFYPWFSSDFKKILVKIKAGIPKELFQGTFVSGADISRLKEVILSRYLLRK